MHSNRRGGPCETSRLGRTSRLVLSDWAADVENIASSRDALLYELLISALMYDVILIQDECIVLSEKLAGWFGTEEGFELFAAVLDSGAFVILTLQDWPSELLELRVKRPMVARARYIEKYATKGEHQFRPTAEQSAFYNRLDCYLAGNSMPLRQLDAANTSFDLIPTFGALLKEVLSNRRYSAWLSDTFGSVPSRIRETLAEYTTRPESAAREVFDKTRNRPNLAYSPDGRILFTRSLAYQLAQTQTDVNQQRWIENVTQSAFAAAFCANLESAGRYAGILKELVVVDPSEAQEPFHTSPYVLKVERDVRVSVPLPSVMPEQIRAWLAVRDHAVGRELRDAVRTTSPDWAGDDELVELAWREIAGLLVTTIIPAGSVSVISLIATVAKELVKGLAVRSVPLWAVGKTLDSNEAINAAVVAACVEGVYHGVPLLKKAYESDAKLEQVRRSLTSAWSVRCVKVGVVPFAVLKQGLRSVPTNRGGGSIPTELL